MELRMEALTRKQIGQFNQHIPESIIQSTTLKTFPSTTTTTTTTTTTEIPTTTKKYPRVHCGGKGFYQVGSSCYSFTFYRSVTYEKAVAFYKVCLHENKRTIWIFILWYNLTVCDILFISFAFRSVWACLLLCWRHCWQGHLEVEWRRGSWQLGGEVRGLDDCQLFGHSLGPEPRV